VGLLTKIVKGGAPLDQGISEHPKIANSTHSSAAFKVDQIVDVSRRTEAGVNEPGGAARITAVHVKRGGVESYNVHNSIRNRNEKKLPPAILSERIVHEGRPRRSSLSAQAGALFNFGDINC
jgi:hypothetical protein